MALPISDIVLTKLREMCAPRLTPGLYTDTINRHTTGLANHGFGLYNPDPYFSAQVERVRNLQSYLMLQHMLQATHNRQALVLEETIIQQRQERLANILKTRVPYDRLSPQGPLTPPSSEKSPDKVKSETPSPKNIHTPGVNKRKATDPAAPRRKTKSARKGSNNDSPISGIVIKLRKEGEASHKGGDIDSKYNVVDRSEESQKKLNEIENNLGDYNCQLCKGKYTDVYSLAEHKCPSIIFIEYKCPECNKVFNCPANLASHRRWHKPKGALQTPLPAKLKGKLLMSTDTVQHVTPTDSLNNKSPQSKTS